MAKKRLAKTVSTEFRMKFTLEMLLKVGRICRAAGYEVFCVSPDKKVRRTAEYNGWRHIDDRGRGLNHAIRKGLKILGRRPAVVILPDTPFLNVETLKEIEHMGRRFGCIISPDLRLNGTNILYVKNANTFQPMYGRKSFIKHYRQLIKKYDVKIYYSLQTAFDVDTPADLTFLPRFSPTSPSNQKK